MQKRYFSLYLAGIFLIFIIILTWFTYSLDKEEIEIDFFCLDNVDFEVKNECFENNKLKFKVMNNAYELDGFLIKSDNSSFEIKEKIRKFEKKEITADINLDNIKEVDIFGIIDKGTCTNYKTIKNINLCSNNCNDGTFLNKCSEERPFYCDNGKLIENCKICGCKLNYYCNNQTCTLCKESWLCSEWSLCENKVKKRGCFDLNKCKTVFTKPVEEEKC